MTKPCWSEKPCLLSVGLLLASCAGAPRLPNKATGDQLLAVKGLVEHGPYALGRADLMGLPRTGFRAVDPETGREARFDGVSLFALLAERVEQKRGADTVVVETADGLRLPLPMLVLRQNKALLADTIDGAPVAPQLVWPNVEQRGLDRDPRAGLWWAHGVTTIEVIPWERAWGRALRAPPGASDLARLGAGQFGLRCAACHGLNGVGGKRGPALDGATARLGTERFVAAVRAHKTFEDRLGTELTPGDDVAQQVAAFVAAAEAAGPPEPASPDRAGRKDRDGQAAHPQ